MSIFRNLYKTAAVLKMEAVLYVETLVSGYRTLRRQIAEESKVKSGVLPAVQYNRHCLVTQNTASRSVAVPTRAVQSVSTTAASHST